MNLFVTGVMHEADDAYSVWSTLLYYCPDQSLKLDFVKIFSVLLDLLVAYRTLKLFLYTGKILPVASLIKSAFLVSIFGRHLPSAFATSSSNHQARSSRRLTLLLCYWMFGYCLRYYNATTVSKLLG